MLRALEATLIRKRADWARIPDGTSNASEATALNEGQRARVSTTGSLRKH